MVRNLEQELATSKTKITTYEKLFDLLVYFFKKVDSYYCNVSNNKGDQRVKSDEFLLSNLDSKLLQSKLIELETFIIEIVNDNNQLENKYNKILSIHTKAIKNDSIDLQKTNIETIKKLNEKVYDLSEENLFLKKQIEDLVNHIQLIDKSEEEISAKRQNEEVEEDYKTLENRIDELEKELSNLISSIFIL